MWRAAHLGRSFRWISRPSLRNWIQHSVRESPFGINGTKKRPRRTWWSMTKFVDKSRAWRTSIYGFSRLNLASTWASARRVNKSNKHRKSWRRKFFVRTYVAILTIPVNHPGRNCSPMRRFCNTRHESTYDEETHSLFLFLVWPVKRACIIIVGVRDSPEEIIQQWLIDDPRRQSIFYSTTRVLLAIDRKKTCRLMSNFFCLFLYHHYHRHFIIITFM